MSTVVESGENSAFKSFNIGEYVQVSSKIKNLRYMTHFVGADPVTALITMLPTAKQLNIEFPVYKDLFEAGDILIMRLVVAGIVYAFQTEVRGMFTQQTKLLITSIPAVMQKRGLRSQSRYPCTLRCRIHADGREWDALVTNISMGGMQLSLQDLAAQAIFKKMCGSEKHIEVEIVFPFNEGNEEGGRLKAAIKSINFSAEGSLIAGCQFLNTNAPLKRFFELSQLDLLPQMGS
jgi:hypothetical protein